MLGNGLHWLGEIFLRYRDYVGQWSPLTVRYSSGTEIMLGNGLHWLGEIFLRYRDYVGQWSPLTLRYSSGTEIMLGNGLHWLGEIFLRYRDYVGQWSPLTGWDIPQVQRLCWAMVSIDWVRYSSGTEIMLGNGLHWLGEIFLRCRDYVGQWSLDWVRYSSGTEIM